MQLSQNTLVLLARAGDDQAIEVLRDVENETEETISGTKFFFQMEPGIFVSPKNNRRKTMLGMPAMTDERVAELLASRNRS